MNTSRSMIAVLALLALIFASCAGTQRGCASINATQFGADWIVVQMDMNGVPYRCWELHDTSIANEGSSDGVYWLSPQGHLVHISGHYNRVQVQGRRWDEAFAEVGLTQETCRAAQEARIVFTETGGHYEHESTERMSR